MHDPTKVLLGRTQSSDRTISIYDDDPILYPAGLAVSLGSDEALDLFATAGPRIGVSLGPYVLDETKTAVIRAGLRVPIQLEGSDDPAEIFFVEIGERVFINDVTGKADDESEISSVSNAIYSSLPLTGVKPDGTTCAVAFVDMPGGL